MKRVILDENLPVDLRLHLLEFAAVTVVYQGWKGIQNGELLDLIDGNFEVFLTGDKKLRYQQNIGNRGFAIVELPSTRLADLEGRLDEILECIRQATPGGYFVLGKG